MAPSPGLQELNDDIVRQHPNVSWAGSPTKDAGTAELPTGTLTFLFTDLEGSTRLWEEHPEAMHEALARHDEILRVAIGEHGGYIVKPTGDGVHAAFGTAEDALAAAIAGQRAVADEAWGATGALRVRMGLHTGAAEARDGDYYGSSVNRAARVMSVAHGGQVVLSHATEEVVCDSLVGGVELVDLGEHRLRDLARAERLFQLCAPGLATEFPPLRSLDAFPGNLPLQLTSFVGRDAELSAIAKALDDWRLVTLTGVGGVGKTRVALQLAAQVLPEHPDGAWLCELVPATDRDALERLVGATLRVLPQPGLALVNAICDFLRSKRVLLLFDNCEHLLDEVGRFAETLLHECPKVRILATSREALGVPGERILGLRSLALPDPSATVASIATTEASRLFVERAGAARADFALDDLNAGAVAEICRRLDGIPLAIELAAARVVALRPMEIAALLDERFRLLAGGVRTGVERHRTLRATVEWSYSLLAPTERTVFDRLGVFSGSFDARAALSVVATEGLDEWDARETLSSLVAKSVVVDDEAPDGTTRYRLLETLRQYALERLGERGDVDGCRRRHAAHYVAFAEAARPGLRGPDEYACAPTRRDRARQHPSRALVGRRPRRPRRRRVRHPHRRRVRKVESDARRVRRVGRSPGRPPRIDHPGAPHRRARVGCDLERGQRLEPGARPPPGPGVGERRFGTRITRRRHRLQRARRELDHARPDRRSDAMDRRWTSSHRAARRSPASPRPPHGRCDLRGVDGPLRDRASRGGACPRHRAPVGTAQRNRPRPVRHRPGARARRPRGRVGRPRGSPRDIAPRIDQGDQWRARADARRYRSPLDSIRRRQTSGAGSTRRRGAQRLPGARAQVLGLTSEAAITLADSGQPELAAVFAGIIASGKIAPLASMFNPARMATVLDRLRDDLGPERYAAAFARGDAMAAEQAVDFVLAELDHLPDT